VTAGWFRSPRRNATKIFRRTSGRSRTAVIARNGREAWSPGATEIEHPADTNAAEMVRSAKGLAEALATTDLPIFARDRGTTMSHQFAVEARRFGGGQAMAKLLRRANILSCGIGLPLPEIDGDVNGLRMGTPELVRWGMTADHMPRLAGYIADVLLGRSAPEVVASEVTEYRAQFQMLRFVR
jgi:glycine hydroxymethyltransferase